MVVWLRYVGWGFLAAAAMLYILVRLGRLRMSGTAAVTLYLTFLVLGCTLPLAEEAAAERLSPKVLAVGRVIEMQDRRNGESFAVQLQDGRLSPRFTGEFRQHGVEHGDLVGVLYRVWDDAPVSIDELGGPRAGSHFRRPAGGTASVLPVAAVGLIGLLSIVLTLQTRQRPRPKPEVTLHLND